MARPLCPKDRGWQPLKLILPTRASAQAYHPATPLAHWPPTLAHVRGSPPKAGTVRPRPPRPTRANMGRHVATDVVRVLTPISRMGFRGGSIHPATAVRKNVQGCMGRSIVAIARPKGSRRDPRTCVWMELVGTRDATKGADTLRGFRPALSMARRRRTCTPEHSLVRRSALRPKTHNFGIRTLIGVEWLGHRSCGAHEAADGDHSFSPAASKEAARRFLNRASSAAIPTCPSA